MCCFERVDAQRSPVIPCRLARKMIRRPELNDSTNATNGQTEALKPKLLNVLRQGQTEVQAWLDSLPEDERAAIGTADAWAPKDTLTHMTFWQAASVGRLEAIQRGETPKTYDDFQRYNEETFERERLRPWAEVVANAQQTTEAHIAAASAFSEDDLTDTTRQPWLEGRALWSSIAGNGFEHPMEHLGHYYRNHGDLDRAQQIMQRQSDGMLSLDGSDQSRGGVLYNQGCFWALAGQSDRAVAMIREALTLRPDLVEWSKQDSDLVTLRDRPDFQAIYASTPA